jgi:hypothetical protein
MRLRSADVVGVLKQEVLAVRSKLKAANAVMKKLAASSTRNASSHRARSYERRIRLEEPGPCGWDLSKCKGTTNAEVNVLAIKITKVETAPREFERRIPANEKRIEFAANRKEYVAM